MGNKVSKECDMLMGNSKILEDKIQSVQTELKQLNELHDFLNEERYGLWRECAQYHDYDNLKESKRNLWVECKTYEKTLKFLNDKLDKSDDLRGKPQDIEKLHQEIDFF
ncbi:hypothetical protein AAZX31_06G193200 [Glycine max]